MEKFNGISKSNCYWRFDKDYHYWDASCGCAFVLIDGGLVENDCHFCCKCGGRIVEIEIEDEDEDEDE